MKFHWLRLPLLLLYCIVALGSFPNCSSPITANPPLHVQGTYCGSSSIFTDVELRSYGQIAYGAFLGCPCGDGQRISAVVLDIEGAVRGTQFDRFGAMWVGGIEILRTTTPEPTPAGIVWTIRRDITDYASLLHEHQNVSFSIPNVIDGPYNGVLTFNVSFHFYTGGDSRPPVEVLGVLQKQGVLEQPWTVTSVKGTEWLNASLPEIAADTHQLFLDVFASGHQCEEFEAGYDCGGPLRRLRVHIDDHPAGVMYPFPVIYTGGVNPLLWRPLTGIASFDVPPYRFELTPFLPLLVSGNNHTLSMTVDYGTPTGLWYLDPVLIRTIGTESIIGGTLLKANLSSTYRPRNVSSEVVVAEERSAFVLRAAMHYSRGVREVAVRGSLSARANYTTIGGGGGPTMPPDNRLVRGESRGTVSRSWRDGLGGWQNEKVSFEFPYAVNLSQSQGDVAFDIHSNVSYSRHGSVLGMSGRTRWSNDYSGNAHYQRDSNRTLVAANNSALETYQIESSDVGVCFNRQIEAKEGSVISDTGQHGRCQAQVVAAAQGPLPSLGFMPIGTEDALVI